MKKPAEAGTKKADTVFRCQLVVAKLQAKKNPLRAGVGAAVNESIHHGAECKNPPKRVNFERVCAKHI